MTAGLFFDRREHARMAVAERGDADAGEQIDVLGAVGRADRCAAGVCGGAATSASPNLSAA